MEVLLDTHVLLWYVLGDAAITDAAREAISDPSNRSVVSTASIWEMSIKLSIGKLDMKQPLSEFVRDHVVAPGVKILPVGLEEAVGVSTLPFHHRDPFDRLLVSQSLSYGLPIVSADPV